MSRGGPQAKSWCFTLNNYTQQNLDKLSDWATLSNPENGVVYLCYGKEVGQQGTPHLQGIVCFRSRKRLQFVISVIGQAHCSVTRGIEHSIIYCQKDGDYYEFGTPPSENTSNGERNDLEDFKTSVKEGICCMKQLRERHSSICARYPRFVKEYLEDHAPKCEVPVHPLRQWQQDLHAILILPPDPRKIIFVVDQIGNSGKSWFARYYCDLHENSQIIIPSKKADMAFIINPKSKVLFFDCPRSKQGEFVQYDFLEELKNGYFFSPKYESMVKKMKPPHIVVCMNEHPDRTKLSADRFQIIVLS